MIKINYINDSATASVSKISFNLSSIYFIHYYAPLIELDPTNAIKAIEFGYLIRICREISREYLKKRYNDRA